MSNFKTIGIPFALLIMISVILVAVLSRPLEEALVYPTLHFLFSHLTHLLIGVIILFTMRKLESMWFDRIGAAVLVLSTAAFLLMLFVPSIGDSRVFLKIGSFAMQPSIYFALGVVWLSDYRTRAQSRSMKWILCLVAVVVFSVWLVMARVDLPMMILIGLGVMGMMGYWYGFSKISFLFLGGLISIWGFLILNSPHRLQRLQNWLEMLINGKPFTRSSGVDLLISKMHEGLFAYNEWGGILFVVVALLFIWLILNIWRVDSLFAKGIAIMLAVDILLYVVNFLGLTPVKPPVLFIVEYGKSITFESFLMIGMVSLSQKDKKRGEGMLKI